MTLEEQLESILIWIPRDRATNIIKTMHIFSPSKVVVMIHMDEHGDFINKKVKLPEDKIAEVLYNHLSTEDKYDVMDVFYNPPIKEQEEADREREIVNEAKAEKLRKLREEENERAIDDDWTWRTKR